ncbi:MAG: hypothetical protein GYA68_04055, partial [Syntrophorhabdus sp.]|nr:hypothetical protein [Syntrophorhabdus sp.]
MPEYDVNYRENVVATLKHESPSYLPRGEIFFTRTFLNVIFPEFVDDYIEQLASAASLFDLSVVGVDLNNEWSRSLLSQGKYSRLKKYFTVGYINGPVLRSIERLGFKQAMLGIKKDRGTVFRITSDILDDIQDVCSLA